MSDPFGSIAAGVGLADVACRLAKALYTFISDLKDASAELRRLRVELGNLTSILSQIASLCEKYRTSALLACNRPTFNTIRVILEACVGDFRQLQGLLGSPVRQGANVLNRFGKIVKSVFDEKEISQVSLRLETHKASLSIALSVIGRINDLEIHDSVRRTNHNVIAFRTAFDAKFSHLENQLSNGARVTGEQNNRLNRCLTDLITKTTASFSQMDKGFEDVMQGHASINSTTVRTTSDIKNVLGTIDRDQAIRHDRLIQSVSGTEHCLKAMRSDMSQNSSQTNAQLSQINGGLVDVTGLLKSFQFQLAALGDSNTVTTVFHGSPTQAARSLDYVSPHISELISNISAGTQLGSSAEQLRWFGSEFERLHYDSVTARAMELKTARGEAGQPQRRSIDQVRKRRNLLKDALRTFRGNRASQGGLIGREARIASFAHLQVVKKTVQVDLPTGTLYIMVGTIAAVQKSAQRTCMIRLLFIPDIIFRINGLSATFVDIMDYTTRIGPFLSTFGIQPKKSPIFAHIQAGNMSEVRGLFSTQRASASDRDEYGESLLDYAIRSYNFDMIEFLLEQGADALDCNRFGDAALIVFLTISRVASKRHIDEKEILKIIRLLIRCCDVDVYGVTEQIHFDRLVRESMDGVLHLALLKIESQPGQLLEITRMLLQHGWDLEDRTINGATPLLATLYHVHDSELVSSTNLFLDAGADPLATATSNFGCLDYLLVRLSSWAELSWRSTRLTSSGATTS